MLPTAKPVSININNLSMSSKSKLDGLVFVLLLKPQLFVFDHFSYLYVHASAHRQNRRNLLKTPEGMLPEDFPGSHRSTYEPKRMTPDIQEAWSEKCHHMLVCKYEKMVPEFESLARVFCPETMVDAETLKKLVEHWVATACRATFRQFTPWNPRCSKCHSRSDLILHPIYIHLGLWFLYLWFLYDFFMFLTTYQNHPSTFCPPWPTWSCLCPEDRTSGPGQFLLGRSVHWCFLLPKVRWSLISCQLKDGQNLCNCNHQ